MTPEKQTSVTGWHPDVEAIADYAEGLLEPQPAATVEAHLEHCGLCTDIRLSLDEIGSMLGELGELPPAPDITIPDDIAARIDAALAAEPMPVSRETTPGVSRETATAATPGSAVSRETTPGAPSRPFGHAPGSTGPGRPRRRRLGRVLVGASLGIALLGSLVFLAQLSLSPSDGSKDAAVSQDSAAGEKTGPQSQSGTELNQETLGGRVHELLSTGGAHGYSSAPDTMKKGDTEPLSPDSPRAQETQGAPAAGTPVRVPSCVRQAVDATGDPIAVERETVRGDEALLLVFTDPDDPAYVDAYVVDLRCDTDSDRRAELLLRDRYPRP
ncbi:hypothetical protein SRB5_27980 [Streptomyces sp. RB5]|uniref:Putative zinc-finger domain-containing protein n=1 Tax=Streptomyces smaragdinus TaxID=2585196 RepID=A0A7K0CI47_9ACTN|nr:hypothetical protein [Streptomyces smaragdinus]MQY12662.1 hypothetical protein [Streptomyces smaragdinus]